MTPSTSLRNLATSIVRKVNAGVADEEIVAFAKAEIERIEKETTKPKG